MRDCPLYCYMPYHKLEPDFSFMDDNPRRKGKQGITYVPDVIGGEVAESPETLEEQDEDETEGSEDPEEGDDDE